MKTKLITAGLSFAGFSFFAGHCLALTPFSDNFNAIKLDKINWLAGGEGGAKLKQDDGVLKFLVPVNKADEDYAFLELVPSRPGYDENWQVLLDVANTNSHRGNSGPGIWIANAEDGGDTVFFECYGKGPKGGFVASFVNNGLYNVGPDIGDNPGVSGGTIRISFNKTTKIMTFAYRVGKTAKWTKVATFSTNGVGGDRRANWNMNAETGLFVIKIYGFTEGRIVASGTETLDNFVLKEIK
ncbi:MAG: hypothetical protein ABIS50_06530 [Luteolibacter sp.]|uniref:hypothetical protein n=1 Tax=Luteolibacter sp. TaxID=1962973 RepID=UPI0032631301